MRARSGTMPSSSSSKTVRRYISVVSIRPCAVTSGYLQNRCYAAPAPARVPDGAERASSAGVSAAPLRCEAPYGPRLPPAGCTGSGHAGGSAGPARTPSAPAAAGSRPRTPASAPACPPASAAPARRTDPRARRATTGPSTDGWPRRPAGSRAGRLWKYGSLSAVDSGSTGPSMITCRCSAYQGNSRQACGTSARSLRLARGPVRIEGESGHIGRLQQHHPRPRPQVSRDGRQHHRRRLRQARPEDVAHPRVEQVHRLGRAASPRPGSLAGQGRRQGHRARAGSGRLPGTGAEAAGGSGCRTGSTGSDPLALPPRPPRAGRGPRPAPISQAGLPVRRPRAVE